MSAMNVSTAISLSTSLAAARRTRSTPQGEHIQPHVTQRPQAARSDAMPVHAAQAAAPNVITQGPALTTDAASLAVKVVPAQRPPDADTLETISAYLENNPAVLEELHAEHAQQPEGAMPMLTLKGLLGAWGQTNSPYDLNGDGTVGMSDLLIMIQNGGSMPMPEGAQPEPLTLEGLLAAWGTDNPTFDLNGDGTVDTSDLLLMMAKLGENVPPTEPETPADQLTLKGLMAAWGQSNSPYDLNGDGTVDTSDLLLLMQNGGSMPMPEGAEPEPLTLTGLLGAWGTDNSTFDLNGDGVVDVSDLLMLLSQTGDQSAVDNPPTLMTENKPAEGLTIDSLLATVRSDPAASDATIDRLMAMLSEDEV